MKGGAVVLIAIMFCLIPIALMAIWDAHEYILPNFLTYTVIISGLVIAAANGRLKEALIGGLVAGGIFFAACLLGGAGGGDFKMAAGIGIWFGWFPSLFIIAGGCLLGIIFGLIKIKQSGLPFKETFLGKSLEKEAPNTIPLGVFLGIATWGYYLAGYLQYL